MFKSFFQLRKVIVNYILSAGFNIKCPFPKLLVKSFANITIIWPHWSNRVIDKVFSTEAEAAAGVTYKYIR